MHPGSLGTVCSLYLHAFPAVCCPPPPASQALLPQGSLWCTGEMALLISKRLSLPSPFPLLLTLPAVGLVSASAAGADKVPQ